MPPKITNLPTTTFSQRQTLSRLLYLWCIQAHIGLGECGPTQQLTILGSHKILSEPFHSFGDILSISGIILYHLGMC